MTPRSRAHLAASARLMTVIVLVALAGVSHAQSAKVARIGVLSGGFAIPAVVLQRADRVIE